MEVNSGEPTALELELDHSDQIAEGVIALGAPMRIIPIGTLPVPEEGAPVPLPMPAPQVQAAPPVPSAAPPADAWTALVTASPEAVAADVDSLTAPTTELEVGEPEIKAEESKAEVKLAAPRLDPPAQIDRPRLALQAIQQAADRIAEAVQDLAALRRPAKATIELHPAELGSLTITVKATAERVDADIQATRAEVREALAAHQPELVKGIESKGLTLDSFNVGADAQEGDQAEAPDAQKEFERLANLSDSHEDEQAAPEAAPTEGLNLNA